MSTKKCRKNLVQIFYKLVYSMFSNHISTIPWKSLLHEFYKTLAVTQGDSKDISRTFPIRSEF